MECRDGISTYTLCSIRGMPQSRPSVSESPYRLQRRARPGERDLTGSRLLCALVPTYSSPYVCFLGTTTGLLALRGCHSFRNRDTSYPRLRHQFNTHCHHPSFTMERPNSRHSEAHYRDDWLHFPHFCSRHSSLGVELCRGSTHIGWHSSRIQHVAIWTGPWYLFRPNGCNQRRGRRHIYHLNVLDGWTPGEFGCNIRPVLFELKQALALALLGALCWVQRGSSFVHTYFVHRPVSFADK